jgi:hypothetical protein
MQLVCGKCQHVLVFSGDRPSFCSYCGQALTETRSDGAAAFNPDAPTELPHAAGPAVGPVPQKVGGYRLLRELGAGGMGAVYEAEETASGRRVALKVIGSEYAASPDAVERFRQEGRLASMLSHPRCVFVLAVDEEAGRPYIVMELMPGDTLKDLVDRKGPLPVELALARILDVIEGLQEAHRLEIIHRDVKPSNCFLEADGRVKVGDFGLAKSLVQGAPQLTHSGAFLGTLFFASPEQIRGDAVSPQTDVYSVAATLYFLLTGQAPFQSSDAAATLARIVSDPPPPVRTFRPDVSPALDRVTLRGLERDREHRWPDLESFRHALLALTPPPLTREALAPRLAAYLVDFLLVWLTVQGLGLLLAPLGDGSVGDARLRVLAHAVGVVLFLVYFLVLEAITGCSLGKRLFRLRMAPVAGADPPPWGLVALRTAIFCGLIQLGFLAGALLRLVQILEGQTPEDLTALDRIVLLVSGVWWAAGAALTCATMRPGNGFRGLHELASGTRVCRLPAPDQSPTLRSTGGWLLYVLGSRRLDRGLPPAGGIPDRIGGFAIRGVLKWTPGEKVLLGEDASLGRRVFMWLRPPTAPPLDRARREVGRRTRLRWLACGRQGDLLWDAILAPSGCPLPELVQAEGKLAWSEVEPLLKTLAEELAAACADGTLPPSLIPQQVWVQPDGRAQLADTTLTDASGSSHPAPESDSARSLRLLRQVAILALEGRPRQPPDAPGPIHASLPAAIQPVLDRLTAVPPGFETVEQFRAALR